MTQRRKQVFAVLSFAPVEIHKTKTTLQTEDQDKVCSDKIGFLETSFVAHLLRFEEHTDNGEFSAKLLNFLKGSLRYFEFEEHTDN